MYINMYNMIVIQDKNNTHRSITEKFIILFEG